MSRKIIIVFAILLPLIGIAMIVAWAGNAREAALSGTKLVSVVQVSSTIPTGTSSSALSSYVSTVEVPSDVVPAGAIKSLKEIPRGTTAIPLVTGEILTPAKIARDGDPIPGSPPSYEEVTVEISPERGSTRLVKVGAKVVVYASFSSPEPRVVRILSSALISRVNGESKLGSAPSPEEAASSVQVTFAVSTEDAKKILYSSSFGELQLTLSNNTTNPTGVTADPAVSDPSDINADRLEEDQAP